MLSVVHDKEHTVRRSSKCAVFGKLNIAVRVTFSFHVSSLNYADGPFFREKAGSFSQFNFFPITRSVQLH